MKSENTCRLCLNETADVLEDLWEGCDILDKLSASLSHYISLTEDLPKKICSACIQTINDIHLFYQQIIQNEIMLLNRFNECKEESFTDVIEDNNSNGHDQSILSETFKSDQPTVVMMKVKTELHKGNKTFSNDDKLRSKNENVNANINNVRTKNEIIGTKNENVIINNTRLDNEKLYRTENKNLEANDQIDAISDPGDDVPLSIFKENKTNVTNAVCLDSLTNNFTCLTCFEVFSNQLELLRHYRHIELEKFNKDNDTSNADIKPVKYKLLTELDGSVTYKCERCYKKYKLKKYIDRHIKSHIERRPFLCKLCGKTYQTASIIVAHGKMHSGQMYVCAYRCGYQSVHKHVVTDHEKRHRKEYKYKCETCGKGFQVRTSFQQHQNIHNDVRPFRCDQCDKTFHLHKYLMAHKSSVHPQSSYRKPWVCKQCAMPCDSKHSLNLHLKQAHGIVTAKPSLCDICGKVVRDSHQLKHHKRAVHYNIKPYSCGFCSKTFQKKYTLKVHEQTHTGKRYRCGECDRLFTRNDTLARHRNNCHSNCKNKCQKCEKIFLSKLKFAAHQKICTSINKEDSQSQTMKV